MIEHFLNYTLAFYMWLVIGRATLSLFTTDRRNFFYNMFYLPTEPVYRIYRAFLPRYHTIAIVISIIILRYAIVKLL